MERSLLMKGALMRIEPGSMLLRYYLLSLIFIREISSIET